MHTHTLALEQSLLQYLDDEHLSKAESRDWKAGLAEVGTDDLHYLRNRLFELAHTRIERAEADAAAIVRWLDRGTQALTTELAQRQSEHRAHFTPGHDCLDRIISLLNNARSRIDICVFTISDNRLSDAILAAHERGIQVRIITDNDKQHDAGSDVGWLGERGLTIRFDATDNHMHHKFCLVDGHTLINGSFNWTRSASERNQENIVVSRDAALADTFQHQFDALWEAFA